MRVSKDSYLVDDHGLVPGWTQALLHYAGTSRVAAEGHDGVGIRETSLVAGVHVSCLVEVGPKLVGVALCMGIDVRVHVHIIIV